jgi:hypothetical protein
VLLLAEPGAAIRPRSLGRASSRCQGGDSPSVSSVSISSHSRPTHGALHVCHLEQRGIATGAGPRIGAHRVSRPDHLSSLLPKVAEVGSIPLEATGA